MSEKAVQELTYAEASQELERIVAELEAGNLELEQSLAAYKRGKEIAENLAKRLQEAEKEIEKTTATQEEME